MPRAGEYFQDVSFILEEHPPEAFSFSEKSSHVFWPDTFFHEIISVFFLTSIFAYFLSDAPNAQKIDCIFFAPLSQWMWYY